MTNTQHSQPPESTPRPARRWAIYARISRDADGDELGVRRQIKLCRELQSRLGGDLVDVYVDDNLSAYKRHRRPGYERLVDDMRARIVDGIVVYNPDRLTRDDLRGLEDLIDVLNQYDVAVETCRSGAFDLQTAFGRMQARMAGVYARMESERMSERLTDKHAEIARSGHPNGGRRPYGYLRDRVTPDPVEAPIVVELFDRVARGETMTRIADDLNERGVPTSTSSPWTVTTVRRMIVNPRYVARRIHGGRDVGAAAWPALVSDEVFARAGALRDAAAHRHARSSRRYLLTGGLLRCGACGAVMRSKPHMAKNGTTVATYACPTRRDGGCSGVTVRAEPVEQLISDAVIDSIESQEFARALLARQSAGASDSASRDVERLRARLDKLRDRYRSGALDVDEYVEFRDVEQARLADAEQRMASQTTSAAAGPYLGREGVLRAAWPTLSLDRRQAIVRSVLSHVDVEPIGDRPRNVFSRDRIVPHFVA